ncbi:hypothetical protein C5167_043631 [Papaver somniferum]|uniref:Uncharacterized protein n=1 Tax=Papaver somniferum TaxID=3469 RepID=A0A4Y7L996_PAPSO|nr:hypothetical protein C5167_043631 [Papaver somniferum]
MQTSQPLAYLPECQATIKAELISLRKLWFPFRSFSTKDFPTRRPSSSPVLITTSMTRVIVAIEGAGTSELTLTFTFSPTHRAAPMCSKHECMHVWKATNSRTCKIKM